MGGGEAPLDELVHEAYIWIFGKRLRALTNQLRVRSSIDGLVIVYLRQFLTARQRDHDPLGYRLYEVLSSAVRAAIAAGRLYVVAGSDRVRNATILASSKEADGEVALAVDLRPIVSRWNNDLLPEIVTSERMERRRVTDRLQRKVLELEQEGVKVFRFKDLLATMKEDTRARWASLFEYEEDAAYDVDSMELVRLIRPDSRADDMDHFKKLVGCVSGLLDGVQPHKTQRYLQDLWGFLRRFALSGKEALPSNRLLSKELNIPRERLPGLYETLGHLVRKCEEGFAGAVTEI